MAQKILLINPSPLRAKRKKTAAKKRGQSTMAKKQRTAAQKAATRKLVALNKRRARNARKSIARRKPARVSSAKKRAYRSTRTLAPVRRVRRNPVQTKTVLDQIVFPAFSGTAGAVAIDIAWANLPVPVTVKDGPIKHVAKGAAAVGMSLIARKLVSRKTADAMGIGALTVVMHKAAQEMVTRMVPALKMDGVGYYNPALPVGGYGASNQNDMGLYVADRSPGMGLYVADNEAAYNY